MPRSTTIINNYLKYEFRGEPLPAVGDKFFINLSTTAIDSSGSGSTIPNGNGYAELVLTKNEQNWVNQDVNEITNSVIISFPSGTGVSTGDWGTIMAITLSNTSMGAPVYFYNLQTSAEVNIGDRITFEGGSLKFKRIDKGE